MVRRVVTNSTKSELFGALVEKFDMVCIAAKCTDECRSCKQCHYALEQMSALAQGEQTCTCPRLFNDLADEYVAVKRRVAA
ncbi:hypothetical protein ANCCEY_14501 [Ancylostoma ceylanicum]|uniref:Uncharacterized protein n=1 Tax=Ancylostoma ceylanicum TaxID=53326 RepID=A0A0D6L5F9_9BILA|nr:hypothetical protein ANCCEY_14501 [Ancylostoma ceylanicum]